MRSEDTPGTRPPGRLLELFSVAVLLAAAEERSDSTGFGLWCEEAMVPLFHSLPSCLSEAAETSACSRPVLNHGRAHGRQIPFLWAEDTPSCVWKVRPSTGKWLPPWENACTADPGHLSLSHHLGHSYAHPYVASLYNRRVQVWVTTMQHVLQRPHFWLQPELLPNGYIGDPKYSKIDFREPQIEYFWKNSIY